MDGPLIATIVTSSVAVVGSIGIGYMRISSIMADRLAEHGKSIGRLEGKLDIVVKSYQSQFDNTSDRMDRMDTRINNISAGGKHK